MVLAELKLPYTIEKIEFSDVKAESYVKLNPNGRLPTIEDPNTSLILWEVSIPMKHLLVVAWKVNPGDSLVLLSATWLISMTRSTRSPTRPLRRNTCASNGSRFKYLVIPTLQHVYTV
jgi:hypothetical protein